MATHNPVQTITLKYPRVCGAALLAFGGVTVYISLIAPLKDIQAHAARVEISGKGSMVGILLCVFGLTYLCFGARFARIFLPGENDSKTPAYIAGAILAILGIAIDMCLRSYLQSEGYTLQW